MGFLDGVGAFVGLAKDQFKLTNFEAQLIPLVGFIAFGVLSVPLGLLQDRTSKKKILLAGLIVMLAGTAISATGLTHYSLFLATVLLLGVGATILQVAGNPIMRDVSGSEHYSRNLSLAQFIKAIGSLSGPLVSAAAAGLLKMDWQILFPIYTVTLAVTVVWVGLTRIEEHKDAGAKPASLGSCLGSWETATS